MRTKLVKSMYCFIYQLILQIRTSFDVTFSGHSINVLYYFFSLIEKKKIILSGPSF